MATAKPPRGLDAKPSLDGVRSGSSSWYTQPHFPHRGMVLSILRERARRSPGELLDGW